WGEIGRHQALYPDRLILRSSEIITYRGHAMNHGSATYVDHRAGPLYELDPATGALTLLRPERLPAEMFADIEAAGGLVQLNHVTTCPSDSEYCLRTCRGCPWDYTRPQTDYERVSLIELVSGSLFKWGLFGETAIAFWKDAVVRGYRIGAVGVSDSHDAGRTGGDALAAAIGDGATGVYAESLSAEDVLAALAAGHTYAKLRAAGPDLRFSALGDDGGTGIMGDAIPDRAATLSASVLNLPAN